MYCYQLSTGIIFKTKELLFFDIKSNTFGKGVLIESFTESPEGILNHYNKEIVVKNFSFHKKDLVCCWIEEEVKT